MSRLRHDGDNDNNTDKNDCNNNNNNDGNSQTRVQTTAYRESFYGQLKREKTLNRLLGRRCCDFETVYIYTYIFTQTRESENGSNETGPAY